MVDEAAVASKASGAATETAEGREPAEPSAEKSQTTQDKGSYGSAARRAGRNVQKARALPPVDIPPWFLERNVFLQEDLRVKPGLFYKSKSNPEPTQSEPNGGVTVKDSSKTGEDAASPICLGNTNISLRSDRYGIDPAIWLELRAYVAAGLQLPSVRYSGTFPATKAHLLLHCPEDGGTYFLDAVVESVASDTGADLLCLDPQDIAELGGAYFGEASDMSPYTLRSLGYDAHRVVSGQDGKEAEDLAEDEDELDDDQDDAQSGPVKANPAIFAVPAFTKISAIPVKNFQRTIAELLKNSGNVSAPRSGTGSHKALSLSTQNTRSSTPSTEWSNGAKLSFFIEALLASCQLKKSLFEDISGPTSNTRSSGQSNDASNGAPAEAGTENKSQDIAETTSRRPLIVLIRDYKELSATQEGSKFLRYIHEFVRKSRKNAQRILIIGATSSADLVPSVSKSGLESLQSEFEDTPTRTIVVTPWSRDHSVMESTFAEDLKSRTRRINLRHLRDMIERLSFNPSRTSAVINEHDLAIDSAQAFASGLDEFIWPFDRVHRTAVLALGLLSDSTDLSIGHLEGALHLLESSDKAKYDWLNEEQERGRSSGGLSPDQNPKTAQSTANRDNEDRMKRLRKDCTPHEKKLLGGVINVQNIHTTFADVRAPPENIEALKTLTSLSLIRPEAFTYGVLATDRIPGLLLYGPPGTGKTLLAKAVAKESGATMLEVSGSEIYDMYVGEGEKNVKAIFSLARKLSPCIVFIDEADAIFGSRGGGASAARSSHRELINQFLREWDGLTTDLSAFIMVATNRPFDLDDAVLRRLPRRLLVDLPLQNDREAILTIHLKDEILAPGVSLPALAASTPLYSGSDLKNLAVAAALACVRDENADAVAAAASHVSTEEPYKYPEKRTLRKGHFDRALEEIGASISEDMSSLAAIRKFDEKFGERRGRRRGRKAWGFGTGIGAGRDGERGLVDVDVLGGRVRN